MPRCCLQCLPLSPEQFPLVPFRCKLPQTSPGAAVARLSGSEARPVADTETSFSGS